MQQIYTEHLFMCQIVFYIDYFTIRGNKTCFVFIRGMYGYPIARADY